ncbi:hypothetical protein MKK67_09770 [Methylobacterium sp. J-072]|uniref:hypothetical protein n=1 Tax=Methylobacterium sp. J-072 TaxID=2836651 RepID=UPI001FBBC30D|nr:hypothetical protein [Methylobacterium sp. J-072]MCJ2092786.1 hypothetical protein [Methylobacterium sp. J-072]
MAEDPPRKVDPAYPAKSDVLTSGHEAAIGTLGAAVDLAGPLAGSLVQALIRKYVQAPLEVRREAWFNTIGSGLREMQDRFEGFDPGRLAENEEFVSAVAETTRVAMATHRAEKLEALRNIVLNAAVGVEVDDVSRGTFMALVERFSAIHLRVLRALENPMSDPAIAARGEANLGSMMDHVLHHAFKEFLPYHVQTVVITDLTDAHLIREFKQAAITRDPATSNCLDPLGEAFLRFIASPLGQHEVSGALG